MKKIYTLILAIFFTCSQFNLKAAEGIFNFDGIVITDLNGTSWDLGELQSQGKTIVLDFWATWCGPCINSIPYKNEIWNQYGPTATGDSSIYFFSIENDQSTNNEQTIINQQNQVNPVFRVETLTGISPNLFAYGGGIPYYVVVCPNGYWQDRTGGLGSTAPILNFAGDCSDLKSLDAFLYDISSDFSVCPSEITNSWQLNEVSFANLGSSAIESGKVFVKLDGIVVEIVEIEETIAPRQEFSFTPAPFNFYGLNHQNVSIEIYSLNGESNLDLTGPSKSLMRGTHMTSENNITLRVHTDPWPEETGYQIRTSNNTLLINQAAGVFSGQQNTIVSADLELTTPDDCHIIRITDTYGDGIVNGGFELVDGSGTIILSNFKEFENVINDRFYYDLDSDGDGYSDIVENLAGTNPNDASDFPDASMQTVQDSNGNGFSDELMTSLGLDPEDPNADPLEDPTSIRSLNNANVAMNLYPSPTKRDINIELGDINLTNNIQVEIFNLLGKKVYSDVVSTSKLNVNVSSYSNGLYLVSILENGKVISNSKFVVNK